MEVRVSMREEADGLWVAMARLPIGSEDPREIRASGGTREACLANLRTALAPAANGGPLTVIVEVVPFVVGVAETARILGWDKRRVVTYADRGRFPQPVQALASGRLWLRSDVERFAALWRARRALRRRPGFEPAQ